MGSNKFYEEEKLPFLIQDLENKYNVVFKERTAIGSPDDWQPYFHYIDYFSARKPIDEHQFYIAASFTYGWMPTMLKKINYNSGIEIILNNVLQRKELNEGDLIILTRAINNSLVGVSKLLHFIAPEKYPIWDSRVYFSLFGKQYYSKNNTNRLYLKYMQNCKAIVENEEYNDLHKKIIAHTHLNVQDMERITKIRSIELLLYLHGQMKELLKTKN